MSREDLQMKIRLPVDLKQQVEEAAKDNNRSINAEVVGRLARSFRLDLLNADELGEKAKALLEAEKKRLEALEYLVLAKEDEIRVLAALAASEIRKTASSEDFSKRLVDLFDARSRGRSGDIKRMVTDLLDQSE